MEKLGLNHNIGLKRFINKTSNNLKLRNAIKKKQVPKIIRLWEDENVQQSNAELFSQIVEVVRESDSLNSSNWDNFVDLPEVLNSTNDYCINKNTDEFLELIKFAAKKCYKEVNYTEVLQKTDKIIGDDINFYTELLDDCKEDEESLNRIWKALKSNVKENTEVLNKYYHIRAYQLENYVKNTAKYLRIEEWTNVEPEVQRLKPELLEYFLEDRIKSEDTERIKKLWMNTDYQVQRNSSKALNQIIEFADANTSGDYYLSEFFFNTDNQVLKQNERMMKISFYKLYEESSEEQQNIYFDKLLNLYSSNIDKIISVWSSTKPQIQKTKFNVLLNIIPKDNIDKLVKVWINTDKEIQKENADLFSEIIDLAKNNRDSLCDLWNGTNPEVQEKKLIEIIDLTKNNLDSLWNLWSGTNLEVQEKKLIEIIDLVKDNPNSVCAICGNTDKEFISKKFKEIYEIANKDSKLSEEFENRMKSIIEKNVNIFNTLNWNFLEIAEKENYTDEQILRITNYKNIQDYLVNYSDNKAVQEIVNYFLENDTNWIISMNKIINHKDKYHELLLNINANGEHEITEEFVQKLISIISDIENYFEIKSNEDINNYYNKRNEICLKIFEGDFENIPQNLKNLDKDNLYKFALLEYKFGISLEDAKRMVERYGADAKELPKGTLKDYLILLEDIINHDNIEGIIEKAKENETLNEPWLGFPNARNAEGEILNLYAKLYNETLYQTKESDKNDHQETYIDKDGKEHKIDVYSLQDDFNINIRVEGAYREFKEPENFVDYYNNPNIDNHGNCESYVGNDQIASARNTRGVAVGYNHIQKNQLTACGPFDLGSRNQDFSIYNERSEFRTPKQMIDNTRHAHNEMVKDRIVKDENGNIEKYKPDYAIWIEEDTIEERNEPGWQEKRDKDYQWIMTKKLAAQLGIPIVVIDREHYAQREMEKVDLLEKLITGEEIDKEKYRKYIEEFSNLSKAELVKELITKYENNRVGLQFNEKLWFKYFSQERFENIINDVFSNIENTISEKEKKEILMELSDVANKEETETEMRLVNLNIKAEKERAKSFYGSIKSKCKELTQTESIQETNNEQAQNNIELRKMLELYFKKGINYDDLNEQKRKLIKDMELVKQGERGQNQEVK